MEMEIWTATICCQNLVEARLYYNSSLSQWQRREVEMESKLDRLSAWFSTPHLLQQLISYPVSFSAMTFCCLKSLPFRTQEAKRSRRRHPVSTHTHIQTNRPSLRVFSNLFCCSNQFGGALANQLAFIYSNRFVCPSVWLAGCVGLRDF